jgi:hypothetical protein
MNPRTETLQDRRNLRQANRLLEEAGWVVGRTGAPQRGAR